MDTVRDAIEFYISLIAVLFPQYETMTHVLIGYLFVIFCCVLLIMLFYKRVLDEAEQWIHNGGKTSVSDRVGIKR